jgi:HAD superfamily hydrolase (TIGR01509 family)
MNPRALGVIFDMDGVLVDTVGRNWQAHNEILAQYGVQIHDTEIGDFVGRALGDQLQMINERYGLKLDAAEFESSIAKLQDHLQAHVKPKPGVVRLIEELQRLKVPIAVGTSSPREVALKRLNTAGLIHHFETIVTRDEVEHHKPNPEVYLFAAKELVRDPRHCVVIEDAPSGLLAAHNAGAKCVAVTVSYVDPKRMESADLVVRSLEGVTAEALALLL